MASFIGSIGYFDSAEESRNTYVERLELFVDCNDIKLEKKLSTLLTAVGVMTYSLVKDLCVPVKPSSKSYDEIVKLMEEHLYPKPSFISERYKFSLRNQLQHESVADYIVQLKHLSTHCDFKEKLGNLVHERQTYEWIRSGC